MTSLLEGARKLVTRSADLGARIDGLDAALAASRGHLPDELLQQSQAVLDRATSRLRLSADHTIVAIAGATGSGKSSTFNALTGLELSAVGVRRPTTSWAWRNGRPFSTRWSASSVASANPPAPARMRPGWTSSRGNIRQTKALIDELSANQGAA